MRQTNMSSILLRYFSTALKAASKQFFGMYVCVVKIKSGLVVIVKNVLQYSGGQAVEKSYFCVGWLFLEPSSILFQPDGYWFNKCAFIQTVVYTNLQSTVLGIYKSEVLPSSWLMSIDTTNTWNISNGRNSPHHQYQYNHPRLEDDCK